MDNIVIVDYGVGNLGSIVNMLKKIGFKASVASDAEMLQDAEKLILPGVGAFDAGMRKLRETGLIPTINELVLDKKIPTLGLCMGMQLMTQKSTEGVEVGLGWFNAETIRFHFPPEQGHLKIPHMGWNTISPRRDHPLFTNFEDEERYYFVHSYHVICHDENLTLAETEHGYSFPSIIQKENIIGAQFHPEKSHKFGMKLLKNFAEII